MKKTFTKQQLKRLSSNIKKRLDNGQKATPTTLMTFIRYLGYTVTVTMTSNNIKVTCK